MTTFCLSIETVLVRSQKGNKVNKWGRKEGRKRGEEGRERSKMRGRGERKRKAKMYSIKFQRCHSKWKSFA